MRAKTLSGERRKKGRRAYSPKVEGLEALRLLSSTTSTLHQLVAEHGGVDGPELTPPPLPETPSNTGEAWDAALADTELSDLLSPASAAAAAVAVVAAAAAVAAASSHSRSAAKNVDSGLSQLGRYLSRTWYRAGISPQQHDDCTQAVYTQLLQLLGRDQFDALAAEVGEYGIRDVLSRETVEGPDFFRAIDTIKKRAQREKTFQPLDGQADPVAPKSDVEGASGPNGDLHEAIASRLSPREAALVYETLRGSTPSEIAQQWGVAPKTVSNEKTRAFQKLRSALVCDWAP